MWPQIDTPVVPLSVRVDLLSQVLAQVVALKARARVASVSKWRGSKSVSKCLSLT